ncbi:RNA repair transcriptional activator RtcR [Methylotenera sp.]|uniref:RNA repair transcriptional activator RtcR n=1 Tax=Methylotenera sp. TaxID=2051956 RepID=UPI0024891589|nr:RNA repair transcriptional activator RtcR [Methylotenera sp.]MDI1298544.1 RNA repair transcriptional activator RtcR [Methylotenera sp.]
MNNVVIGILGSRLDHGGLGKWRFGRWRPSVSILLQQNFAVSRFVLIHHVDEIELAKITANDMRELSPQTEVVLHEVDYQNPWDFEMVYSQLYAFSNKQVFDIDKENYYVHITTGSHVAQICLFLLTEARYLPAKLLQTSPLKQGEPNASLGTMQVIDLDLSQYDQIASRFAMESLTANAYLKDGIATRNANFNRMIEQIEQVAIKSSASMLLTGPTGAGKTRLAKRIYALKKQRGQIVAKFVDVNCATLRGDNAMSTLFGHVKGAFTGAMSERLGLLREANNGLLFLDEVGELGLDEQAMLLRAIEDKEFTPLGSDKMVSSNFQLIAGTNQQLYERVQQGLFREDLLARINLWTYELPSLKERIEDLEPNVQFELQKIMQQAGYKVSFSQAALSQYLTFGYSAQATWRANFRDLNASITRMATLAEGGRINESIVQAEITRLIRDWQGVSPVDENQRTLAKLLSQQTLQGIDFFDQAQLTEVIKVCKQSKSAAEAGRVLFNVSRQQKTSSNDTNRLKVYLQRFNLSFEGINAINSH